MTHPLSVQIRTRPGLSSCRAYSVILLSSLVFALCRQAVAQLTPEYELPPLLYSQTAPDNSVARLQSKLENNKWQPPLDNDQALLKSTLEALEVPLASQVLVFSKTSLQRRLIHPRNPRALYFSDDAYVGWVPGGLMEFAVTDPALGLAFFRLSRFPDSRKPIIERDADCLSCHAGPLTGNWPGLMVRSVFTDNNGELLTAAGSFITTHESPLSERWGGWYVTGSHGETRHMGNAFASINDNKLVMDRESGANLQDLSGFLPTERYPIPDSDLVALMVLEHQVEMHNRLARASLRTRRWIHYQERLRQELGQPPSPEPTGSARVVIDAESKRILEYLLFSNEASLPDGGIRGHDRFTAAFQQNRRIDRRGRSLKDLDLQTRLFQFRCSYMIYSQAFDTLPAPLKNTLYLQLHRELTTDTPSPSFQHLDRAERQAIHEILSETKPDWLAAISVQELDRHKAAHAQNQ